MPCVLSLFCASLFVTDLGGPRRDRPQRYPAALMESQWEGQHKKSRYFIFASVTSGYLLVCRNEGLFTQEQPGQSLNGVRGSTEQQAAGKPADIQPLVTIVINFTNKHLGQVKKAFIA